MNFYLLSTENDNCKITIIVLLMIVICVLIFLSFCGTIVNLFMWLWDLFIF